MKQINCIVLVNSDTSENFIHYRMLKKLSIAQDIFMEKSGTSALDFIERYRKSADGKYPDLIIFEYKNPGDLFVLDHMIQSGIKKSSIMIFNLESHSCPKLSSFALYKNGYLSCSDILHGLSGKMVKVA